MTRPTTRQTSNSTSVPDETSISSSSSHQDTLQEILTIMRHLEQHMNDTDHCLVQLETIAPQDTSIFVTSQDIDSLIAEKFNDSY